MRPFVLSVSFSRCSQAPMPLFFSLRPFFPPSPRPAVDQPSFVPLYLLRCRGLYVTLTPLVVPSISPLQIAFRVSLYILYTIYLLDVAVVYSNILKVSPVFMHSFYHDVKQSWWYVTELVRQSRGTRGFVASVYILWMRECTVISTASLQCLH